MMTVLVCLLLVAVEFYVLALLCAPRAVLRWTRRQLLRPVVTIAALLPRHPRRPELRRT